MAQSWWGKEGIGGVGDGGGAGVVGRWEGKVARKKKRGGGVVAREAGTGKRYS